MFTAPDEKINSVPVGLSTDLLYLSCDLASRFEVDQAISDRVDKYLTTPRRGGERPGGIKVGRKILVHLNVWLQAYGLVVQSIERSAGGCEQ